MKEEEKEKIIMYTCLFVLFSLVSFSFAFFDFHNIFFFGLKYLSHTNKNMRKSKKKEKHKRKRDTHFIKIRNNTDQFQAIEQGLSQRCKCHSNVFYSNILYSTGK